MASTLDIRMQREYFMLMRKCYLYAMTLRGGRLSMTTTVTSKERLSDLINYISSAKNRNEMSIRANYFGYSLAELKDAISRLQRHIDLIQSSGGEAQHLNRVVELTAGVTARKSTSTKHEQNSKRYARGLKYRGKD